MTPMTLTQISAQWGVPTSTLRYAILRGDLPATKFGKTWVVELADFEAWNNNEAMHKRGVKPAQDKEK